MNKPTSPVILAIGAHVGDMELTAGDFYLPVQCKIGLRLLFP